jgi:carboxymethylenebutenolidase
MKRSSAPSSTTAPELYSFSRARRFIRAAIFPRGPRKARLQATARPFSIAICCVMAYLAIGGPAEGQVRTPETVNVQSGALVLRGLLWRPSGTGPFPAILYNHGSGPQADPRRPEVLGPVFARHGYVFLYLFRRGAGLSANQGTNSVDLMNRALTAKGQDGRNQVQLQLLDVEMNDVLAGLSFLRAHPEVDASRTACVGHSFGGSLALILAERDPGLRAVVLFGAAAGSWSDSPPLQSRLLAAARGGKAPVFFAYAANDYTIAPAKTLGAEMTRLGRPNRVQIHAPVGKTATEGHDFVHSGVSTWEGDVFAFLDAHLRE